jgi:peptide/nickel transport system substrate-binding protein
VAASSGPEGRLRTGYITKDRGITQMEEFDAQASGAAGDGSDQAIMPGTFGFGFSRRSLMAGTGVLALSALVAAACGGDNKSGTTATTAAGDANTSAAGGATTAVGATTSAGARTEAKTDTLTLGVPSLEEQYVDPHFPVGGLVFPLTWAISEGLYAQDQTGKYLPSLATGYTLSDDKLTWTFKLRSDVKMHDGSTFTAQDMKTAIDRILAHKDFTWYATFQSYVTGANVVDPTTIQITTSKPYATCVVDMPPPIPTNYYNTVGEDAFRKTPMAAGAWKFASQTLNSDVKYTRFEDYFDPTRKPNWKNLVFQIVPDETARVAGIKTGSLDIAYALTAASAQQFQGDSKNKINETKGTAMAYVMTLDNVFPDVSPLKDVNVRKALLMAIDRDGIAKSLYGGFAQTSPSPIPSVMLGYDDTVKPLPYDPQRAKQMLAAAGASNMTLTLNSYNSTASIPTVDKLATTIASFWNQIGIKTTLNIADTATILTAWRGRQLKSTGLIAGPTYFYVEPSRLTLSFFSTKAPYTTVSDPALDALSDQINQETDVDKRTVLGRQLSAMLNTQLWGLPTILVSSLAVTGPNVASYQTLAGCPYAGPLYWLQAK